MEIVVVVLALVALVGACVVVLARRGARSGDPAAARAAERHRAEGQAVAHLDRVRQQGPSN